MALPILLLMVQAKAELTLLGKPPIPLAVNLDPEMAGVSYDRRRYSGVIYDPSHDGRFVLSAEYVDDRKWIIQGEAIDLYGRSEAGARLQILCPLVFGSVSRRGFVLDDKVRWEPIAVTLPASNVPEPRLKEFDVKVGSSTLHFKPRPWISSIFPIRYEVSIKGKRSAVVDFAWGGDKLFVAPLLLVRPGRPGILRLREWRPQETIRLRVRPLQEQRLVLSAHRSTNEKGTRVELLKGSKAAVTAVFEQHAPWLIGPFDRIIEVNGIPFGLANTSTDCCISGWREPAAFFNDFSSGQRVKAMEYRTLAPAYAQFDLNLPDRKIYGGPDYWPLPIDIQAGPDGKLRVVEPLDPTRPKHAGSPYLHKAEE